MLKLLSVVGLLLMVAALFGLVATRSLFSRSPTIVAVQIAAVALVVWARVTFGRRSFHAAANPTEGGLVTTGPYRFMRHPIYTAVCLFAFAGALAHVSLTAAGLALLVFVGALGRMLAEERLVARRYPEYVDYAARTRRMIPFVF
jgi:protein-S-isoprenylcysteine O-methyltransferase Ste14